MKRDAHVPVRRHERTAEVRLAGAERAVDAQQQQPIVACRAQSEHRLAGVGVDEDLVAGGGLQRRATLAQRIGGPYEANGVDGVVGERAVGGMR